MRSRLEPQGKVFRGRRLKKRVAETKMFFLLGKDIGRSISPQIHNKAFKEVSFNATYSLLDINESQFDSTIQRIRLAKDIVGFNITAPYKERIIPHLSELDPQAEAVGAVNTVKVDTKRLMTGYNTDIDGIVASLSKLGFLGNSPNERRSAVVLGAGGAARACVYALARNGFSSITIINRTLKRADAISDHFARLFPERSFMTRRLTNDSVRNAIADCDILVNAISDLDSVSKIDLIHAKTGMKLFDLTYKTTSPLLEAAEKRGIRALDGLLMLVEQAARSFEIWTGISAPRKTMILEARRAIKAHVPQKR